MTHIGLQEAFEIELNKLDDNLTKPKTNIIEYFLNAALDKFWKTRYSENNYKRESFELTQKRIDDLRTLVTRYEYDYLDAVSDKEYFAELPYDYALLLGDTVGIIPADGIENECWEKDEYGSYIPHYSDTIEATIETVDRIKENSLSEYHLRYNKAKPIRLINGNSIVLHTDGKYQISNYIINYLRIPNKIDIHKEPFVEYTDMPEHTHLEIVKLAALLYIENQANPRYNTYTLEIINSME